MDYYTKKENKSIYALYKGNTYIMDGTLEEIAERTGKTVRNLKRYTWKSYNAWVQEMELLYDRNFENRLALILLKSKEKVNKQVRYFATIPEVVYKYIATYSEAKKITKNQVILQCIEYALEHKEENFFKEILKNQKDNKGKKERK